MERRILNAAFFSRSAFEDLKQYLSAEDFTGSSQIIWELIASYYTTDSVVESCDKVLFLSKIQRENPKHYDLFKSVIDSFEDISIPNIIKEAIEHKRYQAGLMLSSALLSKDNRKIESLLEEYHKFQLGEVALVDSMVYEGVAVAELMTHVHGDNLIPLFPSVLNEQIGGGVPRGTSIAIYARPEVGKSLVAINLACSLCHHNLRVLYVGNEDPAASMLMRFISRFSNMSKFEIIKDLDKAQITADANGYKNLIFAALSPGTIREIESLIKTYKPDVLIVDQVRNLNVNADGLVAILEKAAKEVRTLGKKYNIVNIQITQAGDGATNKLVLAMNDVDNSKTGFQAQFDLMVGVGCNLQLEEEGKRMISITKNKINGTHSYFPIVVDTTLNKVVSL